MRKDIEAYVTSCPVCASMKCLSAKPPDLLQSVTIPAKPWEEISMDFVVQLPEHAGKTVIWTVIDLFSKQAYTSPKIPSTLVLAKMFMQHINRCATKCLCTTTDVEV